ncbi:MAG TPA: response regulator [Epsilonproteobacteria bacterium]|nr:response regulator [Campylobacterota bacterium]
MSLLIMLNINLENSPVRHKAVVCLHACAFLKTLAVLLLLGPGSLVHAQTAYMNIVAASGGTLNEAEIYTEKLKKTFADDKVFQQIRHEESFEIKSRKSGSYFITTLEPFVHSDKALVILEKVQQLFPDAFIFVHRSNALMATYSTDAKIDQEESMAGLSNSSGQDQDVLTRDFSKMSWIGLIGLFLISAMVTFLIIKQKRRYSEVIQKNDRLESTIEQQNKVLAGVSEKVLQPLEDINENSEIILKTALDTTQSDAMHAIKECDQLLLELTNDLIDFLNLKSNKAVLRHELFDLNNALDEVAGIVSRKVPGSSVELIYDIEKDVPAKVLGDNYYTGRVLSILLDNAMRLTQKGEVRLHIHCVESISDTVTLQFDITDTGLGYEPARLAEIFEPFGTVDSDSTTAGLSLYIAHTLVELMAGSVSVSSKPGVGSCFSVTIPFEIPDINEKRRYRLPARAYSNRKMLIIEAQYSAAIALKKMLEYFNNDVTVRTVEAVLNKREAFFDNEVILIAERTFTEEIKKLAKKVKREKDAKIVLVGNMTDMAQKMIPFDSLIDARIVKPLTPQRVFDLIYDLFEKTIKEVDSAGVSPRRTKPTAVKTYQYDEVEETPNITKKSFGDFGGASILVVEDNQINQKVLLSLFSGSGINVTVANDGVEALDTVENPGNRFDLVLMDINMPVMDGYEATRRIRAIPELNALPIVSLTGLGLPEEIAKMYAIGMNAHLTKPLKIGRLYTLLKRFVIYENQSIKSVIAA